MTVHNIAFQGWAPAALLATLRLPGEQFHADALEYYGGLSSPEGRAGDGGCDHHRLADLCRRS